MIGEGFLIVNRVRHGEVMSEKTDLTEIDTNFKDKLYRNRKYELDHIYKLIPLEETYKTLFPAGKLTDEFERLKNISQLGLISKIFPLSKHNKFEHSLGVYHLVNRVLEKGDIRRNANLKTNSLRIAALTHSIGHFSFTFAAEKTVLFLASVSPKVHNFVDNMLSSVGAEICDNCNKRGQRDKCYKMVLKDEDIFNFFRWVSAYKLLQKKDNLNQLGLKDFHFRELLKYLVCNENVGKKLLDILDKIDYVIRDHYYLGLIKVDLNIDYYLSAIKIDSQKNLRFHRIERTINELEKYLIDTVYYHRKVKALEGMYGKVLKQCILDETIPVQDLVTLQDSDLEEKLYKFETVYGRRKTKFSELEDKILLGSISFVNKIDIANPSKKQIEIERSIVRRNEKNFSRYPFSECFYVDVTPLPGMNRFRISFLCDLQDGSIRKCFDAIANAENKYDIPEPLQEQEIVSFLLGEKNDIVIAYERYLDISTDIISFLFKFDLDARAIDSVKNERVKNTFFYFHSNYGGNFAKRFMIQRFLDFPQGFTDHFLNEAIGKIRKYRKEKGDRGLEFIEYIERSRSNNVPLFSKLPKGKWIIPHIQATRPRKMETDVFAIYTFENRLPIVDLVECSNSSSRGKRNDAYKQLGKIKSLLETRFKGRLKIRTFFNSELVNV